ncbi:ribosomal subunit 39S-domain-containing protein [Coniochaeta sp. 2T2.1]|nr:ribosomal subunit 39S-domain-containing protein [Coniochaeta sp. 2T2.1]
MRALETTIEVRETGVVALDGHVTSVVAALKAQPEVQEVEPELKEEFALDAQQAIEFRKSWDKSWKTISLEDPRVKFAVNKRVQQLTGHIIPDHKLLTVNTVAGYLGVLVKPAPAKKLAEVIEQKGELQALPNVAVYNRRVTPIDKEKMVGRWKLIVNELEKRDLPVVGTGGLSGNVEKKWARGES